MLNAMLHTAWTIWAMILVLVMVSGIGCSARIAGYVDLHHAHAAREGAGLRHGIKMSRPDLHVIVPMGDGDALAIGATISSTRRGAISSSPRSS